MDKITFADFRKGETVKHVHSAMWQWSYGQVLRIQGLNLPSAVEIHFSLDENAGEAVRRIGITDSGVTDVVIPDFILEGQETTKDHYQAYAFVFLSDEEAGKTTHKIVMKIKTRPRPEGTAPSDETTFGAIMEAVREIAERTGGTVSDEQIQEAVNKFLKDNPIDGLTKDELAAAIEDYFDINPVKVEKENYFADFGVTTYDEILEAIDKGQHVLARYENKHYALSSVSTTTIVFETASNNIIKSLEVSSKSVWSNSSIELQTVGSRMKTMEGVTDRTDLYPSVKAVADYTEKKMEQKMDKPSTAAVGQMVVVKKIDENGKPIEFEAMNVPEGGSGATVTKESIKSALGYTPANESKVNELSGQISDLKENGTGTTVTSGSVKTILSNIMTIMRAQINPDGTPQVYNPDISAIADMTDELIANLGTTEEEPEIPEDVTLSSISVIYTGGSVPVGTALSSLRGLTVTATYSDGSKANVSGYTLSGEIVEGSNTITVTYKGMTDTFTVTGVAQSENVNVTQNGSTLTIIDVPNVTQNGTTLLIA